MAEETGFIEGAFLDWSDRTVESGNTPSYHEPTRPESQHAWSGERHEDGIPPMDRTWNTYRSMRILLSRIQEAVFRRQSGPFAFVSPPGTEYYDSIRTQMTSDICISAAYAFGTDFEDDPPRCSISNGYILILPLSLAGSCLLEKLIEPETLDDGRRILRFTGPVHQDPTNPASTQLAWIIDCLEYIADRIGIHWAKGVAKFLRGEYNIRYDLESSYVIPSRRRTRQYRPFS